jgi:hypothetical protein
MIIYLKLFFKIKHGNLFQNLTYCAASVRTSVVTKLVYMFQMEILFPFDGNVLWHTWHCCWFLLMSLTIYWTSPCQHEWLCVAVLGRQSGFYHTYTPNTCSYTCLLQRYSPISLSDSTSSPHSLYSIPILSAGGAGTEISASIAQ